MKGLLLSQKEALLEIDKNPSVPGSGTFQALVKINQDAKISNDMIGKKHEFELKVPCMQFCGDSKNCSAMYEKVCAEATCTPKEVVV